MKVSALAVAAASFMALVQAAPMPQTFDGAFIDSIPPPTSDGPPAGATKSSPDVDVESLVDAAVSDIEKRGVASDNFVKVFDKWTGSTQTGGYLTFKFLDTYDVDLCATKCLDNTGCVFFNIFYEHNNHGEQIKCALYSIPSTKGDATNYGGQVRDGVTSYKYESAGYKKKNLQEDVPGYTYECFGAASINAPSGSNTYMGVTFSTTSASTCAAACEAKTAANAAAAKPGETYRVCNFFNYYNVYQDNVAYQNACTFYLVPYDASYATNYSGQVRNGHTYGIGESCGYTRNELLGVNGIATKPSVVTASKA
ncbi:hypothetical protein ABW19_dt0205937 [Dactylella cylindrospora]|nr:hypothetical protein ABW19_dt0205937 [Dactylella cylindrospora]